MWYGHKTQIYPAHSQSPSIPTEDGSAGSDADREALHARSVLAHRETLTFRAAETRHAQVLALTERRSSNANRNNNNNNIGVAELLPSRSVDGGGGGGNGVGVDDDAVKNRDSIIRPPFGRMLWHVAGLSGKEEMIECVLGQSLSEQTYLAVYGSIAAAAEHIDAVFRLMLPEAQSLCRANKLGPSQHAKQMLAVERSNSATMPGFAQVHAASRSASRGQTPRGLPHSTAPLMPVPESKPVHGSAASSSATSPCVFDPQAVYKGDGVDLSERPAQSPAPHQTLANSRACCVACLATGQCTHFSVAWGKCFLFHENAGGNNSISSARSADWRFGGDALYRVPLRDAISGRVATRTGGRTLSAYFDSLKG